MLFEFSEVINDLHTSEDLKKMKLLKISGFNNGGAIYNFNDDILYKIFRDRYDYINKKERNVDLLIGRNIPYAKIPLDKIMLDGEFYGYSMENFQDSCTFKKPTNMPYTERLKIIKQVFIAIRQLHRLDVHIGDVHLDNFLYRERNDKQGNIASEGAVIDFETIRFAEDKIIFNDYYFLRKNFYEKFYMNENKNTDNIKATVAALSFLYSVNLEEVLSTSSIGVIGLLLNSINVESMKDLQDVLTNFDGEITYFDELLPVLAKQDFKGNEKELKKRKQLYFPS